MTLLPLFVNIFPRVSTASACSLVFLFLPLHPVSGAMADLDIDTQRGEDLNLQEQGLTSTRITSSSSSRESSFSSPHPFRGTELGWVIETSLCAPRACLFTFQRLSQLIQTSDKMGWDRSLHSHKKEYLHFVSERLALSTSLNTRYPPCEIYNPAV